MRSELAASIEEQGGTATQEFHELGIGLRAHVPVVRHGTRRFEVVRFVGCDGPGWLLRGVLTGAAVNNLQAALELERIFLDTVVVRGTVDLRPRDQLLLTPSQHTD
ncbi:hypothetical protein DN069_13650 [Streptacidiphilus pinicola]|uniref:DUF3710 domain-containing protein n=1 Tax=Streptacidiphilus pinicola TaxID=2219663 RepID=A0A2X0IIR4_9ACTN|nr:hypothetical protein DN069_13650 [Streptacidiphilus pinicola]